MASLNVLAGVGDCVVIPGLGAGKVLRSGSVFAVTGYVDASCTSAAANFTSVPLNTCTGPDPYGAYIFLAPSLAISGTYLNSDTCAFSPRLL